MRITVLIATRNRTASLPRTLESLLCPTNLQADNWEAIVITDASCRDASADICQQFGRRFPKHLRLLIQDKTGKSNALNLGIAAATTGIVAFTDDDVVVAPGYIQSIRKMFENYPADAVQGRVLLDCEGGLPSWICPRLKSFLSWRDFGDEVAEWTHTTHTLTGTNMAVRAQAARMVGGFAPELGAGTAVGFAEDTEFSIRLRQAGCRFFYAPQIVVRHEFSKNRLTRWFFKKRYFRLGRSHAYYEPRLEVELWRYGYWQVRHVLSWESKALRYFFANRPADTLNCQCYAFEQLGLLAQHCRFWLGTPRRLSRVKMTTEGLA